MLTAQRRFPWRRCLQEYSGYLAVLDCEAARPAQQFLLEAAGEGGGALRWRTTGGRCVVPGRATHEGLQISTLVTSDNCTAWW